MESTSLPSPPSTAHLPARAPDRESSVVASRLSQVVIWVLDLTVKVAFITFWHLIFSVIRLQAGW